ncbi:MAG: tol-pal system-associated acyl-CoA thioesterase [Rhodospirillaceae bacterium]
MAGQWDGDAFVMPVRVYYEDTDAAGIVYYANYLKFAERARTESLRALGIEQGRLMADSGVAFAVRRALADYRKPARLDDLLEVRTRLTAVGGASLEMEQEIARDGAVLVALSFKLACMRTDGRPERIPEPVRMALASRFEPR